MSIILNDNLKINAGKPAEYRYLASGNTVYSSTGATNTAIPISLRYVGLTVNINNVEYWYKNGVIDSNLIEKKFSDLLSSDDYVTGATNIGYFSGRTGIQILPIDHLTDNSFDGNYVSLYNYYFRGVDGKIHVGQPSDGIFKRGYVKTTGSVKSWIWNEYTGSSDLNGWILINGNISNQLGTFQNSSTPLYYNGSTKFPYTGTSWTAGNAYNNTSDLVINSVIGSLNTGNTISIGGRPFAVKDDNILNIRTIISETPSTIGVRDDESFIYISGTSRISIGANIGSTGAGIYNTMSGNTLMFKRIIGSGDTNVYDTGSQIVIYTPVGNTLSDLTANNGLSYGGTNVRLGGTLTGTTIISTNNNCLKIQSDAACGYGLALFELNSAYCNSMFNICSRDTTATAIWELSGNASSISALHCVNSANGNSMCINDSNIQFSNKTSSTIKLVCLGANAMVYDADYCSSYTCRTLVDKQYVDGNICLSSNIVKVCTVGAPYTTTTYDDFVGVSGTTCIYLIAAPRLGQRVSVADICGNALASPITIDGNGRAINDGSCSMITTDYGSTTLVYNGLSWSVTAFVN